LCGAGAVLDAVVLALGATPGAPAPHNNPQEHT